MSTAFTMPPLADHLPAGSFDVAASTRRHADDRRAGGAPGRVCRALRDDPALAFLVCVDVTAADHFPREPRYDVVYHLVVAGAAVAPADARACGAAPPDRADGVDVWTSANWQEREVIDLFGIAFTGHPDLDAADHAGRLGRPSAAQGLPGAGEAAGADLRAAAAHRAGVRGQHRTPIARSAAAQ